MASGNKRTYYKRTLPSPPAIAFSSAEGRAIFAEALPLGNMIGFFKLIEQFTTQEEPQYCGLSSLSMTLNALGVDPRRMWKGAWRWFTESMLDCCKSMEEVKRDGITLNQAACLARCNGADVSVHRYGTFDGRTFRQMLREACSSEDLHMVVSYSRKTFLQSGDGHFSPVGGYHPGRDLVLILDVARFKYSPHWVRVDDLMEAMSLLDPAINRPRGFLMISSRFPRESALFAVTPDAVAAASATTGAAALSSSSCSSAGSAPTPATEEASANAAAKAGGGQHAVAAVGSAATAAAGGLSSEPAWTAALRYLTHDAPELMRRMLADPAAARAGTTADEQHDDDDGEEEEEGAGVGSGSGVPTLDSLVEALVAAAPLQSVCSLLNQRQTRGSLDELSTGRCCSCACFSGELGTTVAPPCNSKGCCRGVRLTEAAVAAAAAAAADAATAAVPTDGVGAPAGNGTESSSSGSDAGSLESAGPSDSSFGSTSSLSSVGTTGSGSSSGSEAGARTKCCHGEPLEHHCVPTQVQALMADELRFTNMYKLVSYCLRRHHGCPHVQPPDITAFMQPAMAKPPPPPAKASEPVAAAMASPAASTANAAVPPAAPSAAAVAASVTASPGPCDCGDLGLQDLAAEKLTALLLLLPVEGAWWPQAPSTAAAASAAAHGAANPPPGPENSKPLAAAEQPDGPVAATTAAGGRVRICGRPRCRRCRQRAAAAGDRAAALEVLRERWGQTLRLAPLGLFASSPVLQEELEYIRLQLGAVAERAGGPVGAATA